MHKVGIRLIFIHVIVQNVEIIKQNVINYIMLSYFLYLFKELHKQASEFSSRLENIMVDDAEFNIHDSGGHLPLQQILKYFCN